MDASLDSNYLTSTRKQAIGKSFSHVDFEEKWLVLFRKPYEDQRFIREIPFDFGFFV